MEEAPKARKKEIMRVTLLGSFANFVLLVFKFVAGMWGHSSAMIADAVHSLSDFVTDIIVLLFVNISSKPKDESHDYGHGKYETLATSIVGIVLLCVGFGLFWEGANKIYDFYFKGIPLESPGMIALVAALISIVIKELLYHITVWVGRKQNSQVVIANAWHHRSDAFSSIGTALGIVLLCVGFGLFWEGANKIYDFYFKGIPLESPGMIALVAALISIVIKELLYHITVWVGRKQNSQVVIANAWHHRSDAFSSIGTALGIGGAILLGDNWRVLDPLAAVIVSLFIVKVALQLVIPAINDLLEKSLPKEVEDEILAIISEVPEVKSPHNLRTRRIGNNFAIEAHIRVDGQITVTRAHDLTKEIEQNLRDKFGQATHIALHVEPIK